MTPQTANPALQTPDSSHPAPTTMGSSHVLHPWACTFAEAKATQTARSSLATVYSPPASTADADEDTAGVDPKPTQKEWMPSTTKATRTT